jgi:hypothetical protein
MRRARQIIIFLIVEIYGQLFFFFTAALSALVEHLITMLKNSLIFPEEYFHPLYSFFHSFTHFLYSSYVKSSMVLQQIYHLYCFVGSEEWGSMSNAELGSL